MKKVTAATLIEQITKFKRFTELAPSIEVQQQHLRTVEGLKSQLNTMYDQEQIKFLKKRGGENGEWFELVRKFYFIDQSSEGHMVRSAAANWKEQPVWGPFSHKFEALTKIDELIKFKIHDRKRGFGDQEADIERAAKIADTIANVKLGLSIAFTSMQEYETETV